MMRDSQLNPDRNAPGWETCYGDFLWLLNEISSRAVVAPLLREWFGYEVVGADGAGEIRSASGEHVDPAELHRRIQADPDQRYEWYQRRMSCTHWDSFADKCWQEHVAAQAPPTRDRPARWWRRILG